MQIRLTPVLGGDGTIQTTTAMNDTGSDALTIFASELPSLGNISTYNGWQLSVPVLTADGSVATLPQLYLQVRLIRLDNTPWSNWIDEVAVVRPDVPGVARLTGIGIRESFFFCHGVRQPLCSCCGYEGWLLIFAIGSGVLHEGIALHREYIFSCPFAWGTIRTSFSSSFTDYSVSQVSIQSSIKYIYCN